LTNNLITIKKSWIYLSFIFLKFETSNAASIDVKVILECDN